MKRAITALICSFLLTLLVLSLWQTLKADDFPVPASRFIETDGSSTTEASIPFAQGLSCPAGEQITLGSDFFLKADSLPPPLGQISLGYDIPGTGLGVFSAVFDSVAMSVDNSFTGGNAAFNVWDDAGTGRADLTSGIFRVNYGTPPTGITQVYGDATAFDDFHFDQGLSLASNKYIYFGGAGAGPSIRWFSAGSNFLFDSPGNIYLTSAEGTIQATTGGTSLSLVDSSGTVSLTGTLLDFTGTPRLASLTGPALLKIDASENVEPVTVGSSLSFSDPTLDTIQDIRTTASPSFNRVTSTVATGTSPFAVTSTTKVTNLGADTVDTLSVGTSGNAIPNMNATNTWGGAQTFSLVVTGSAGFTSNSDDIKIKAGGGANYAMAGGTVDSNITAVGNVGAGEDNLIQYTLNKSELSENGESTVFDFFGTFAANANNKRVRCYFGATALIDTTALAFNGTHWRVQGRVVRTGATTQDAIATFTSDDALLPVKTTFSTPAETLSGTVVLKCTGEATSNNDIVQEQAHTDWNNDE